MLCYTGRGTKQGSCFRECSTTPCSGRNCVEWKSLPVCAVNSHRNTTAHNAGQRNHGKSHSFTRPHSTKPGHSRHRKLQGGVISIQKLLATFCANVCASTFSRNYKKLSYCWETVRRESMPRIAEMDVEMTI